jgi:predicted dehydrogenase
MLNVGVLGAGFMGGTHARAYAKLPDVQVVGVSSRSAEKAAALAQEVGGEPFADAMALVNHPRVDALSITLPTNLHKEYVVAALNAGKHILVEKPMALGVDECDAMIGAAEKSGRILMVAHVLRFWPEYVALRDFLSSEEIGKPLSAKAGRRCEPPRWADWFANPVWSGGEVLDLHIHDLDTLNWMFGAPKSVYSLGQRGETGGWDYALSLVDYGDVKCFAEGSGIMPSGYPFTMSLWVLCEKGSAEFTFRSGGEQVDSRDSAGVSLTVYAAGEPPRTLPAPSGDAYARQIAYFVKCAREGVAPEEGTAQQGRLAVKTALAARQSIETGQVVTI